MKVDRDELDRRWTAREPVQGVAFLLNDAVQVVAGPHVGARGAVVSLLSTEPTRYQVELSDGQEVRLDEAALVTAEATDVAGALERVQRWYSARCDGDWEHTWGVTIETLDNPGWRVKVDLRHTPLEGRSFSPVSDVADERAWLDCRVSEASFVGAGGPHMLSAVLGVFLRWAEGEP